MNLSSFLTTILIVAMTLGAMFVLVQATEYVTSRDISPATLRRHGRGATPKKLLGFVLLRVTVWLANILPWHF